MRSAFEPAAHEAGAAQMNLPVELEMGREGTGEPLKRALDEPRFQAMREKAKLEEAEVAAVKQTQRKRKQKGR
jgi:hypothetical protein